MKKKLEAAHHECHRRLMRITWKDKVRNDNIRKKKTGLWKPECIIKDRRLEMVQSRLDS